MRIGKNSQIILKIVGYALLGLSLYETGKAAIKIDRYIDDKRNQNFSQSGNFEIKPEERKEVVVHCLKDAVPAIMAVAGTVLCFATGDYISHKQRLEMTGTIGVLEGVNKGYRAYSNYIQEKSPEMGREARETASKRVSEASLRGYDGERWWKDDYSHQMFRATTEEVLIAENNANRNFILNTELSFNSWLMFLGPTVEPLRDGDEIGWSDYTGQAFYGYRWIDFDHTPMHDRDHGDYILISYPFPPTGDYHQE